MSPSFERYVEQARAGKTSSWRILGGILVIVFAFLVTTTIATVLAFTLSGALNPFAPNFVGKGDPAAATQSFLNSPLGMACAFSSFSGLALGVFIAVRYVQRRPFGTVLGSEGRLEWGSVARGFVAALIASAIAEIAFVFVDPTIERSAMSIVAWLAWLLPLSALLFLQVGSEELAFRGYLTQSLAARFRSPLIWGVLPVLVFGVLHWNGASLPLVNVGNMATIAVFAGLTTALVIATGNLGASMGVHFGMNLFSLLISAHTNWLNGAALFVSRPMEATTWTLSETAALGAINLVAFGLILVFLLSRRSPLRIVAR